MKNFVTRPGFEPRLSEPESEVLPLYYRAIWSANVAELFFLQQSAAQKFPPVAVLRRNEA